MMLLDDAVIAHAKCKGFLKKQGNSWKTWKNRFFVLDENKLYYLESAKDREPLGIIYLQGLVIESAEKETKWKWSFSITTQSSTSVQKGHNHKERKYIIQASNEKDYKMWLDALRNAVFLMKQAEVGAAKDSPTAASVRGSKPPPDRLKYQSRSTDPTPAAGTLPLQASSMPGAQPRRYFSAGADMHPNRMSVTPQQENQVVPDEEPVPSSTRPQPSDGADVRSTFRNSVFEKAVTGLFAQPSSEITATLTEKDRKTSLLRNLTLRGSGTVRTPQPPRSNSTANIVHGETQRSPSPLSPPMGDSLQFRAPSPLSLTSSWDKIPDVQPSPRSPLSGSPANSSPNTPSSLSTPSARSGRELSVLITPWNEMARDALFVLLKTKHTNPLYSKTSLRIRIMASAVPDRTREELESRGVEVMDLLWDDEEYLKRVMKGVNKVLFLPGYSHLMKDWAASLLKATCSQYQRASQLIRVGAVGVGLVTQLGQWARDIDSMFEEEGITSTTVMVDQTFQELCPPQVALSSQPVVIPAFVAGTAIAPVDARDVAALLAMLILSDTPTQSADITIRGPAILTFTQILQAINDTLGVQLSLSSYPPSNPVLREFFEVLAEGGGAQEHAPSTDKIEGIIGKALNSFESFLGDYALKRSRN